MNQTDERWMALALRLAEQGRGYVEPNPMVGAVVVQGDRCVGQGWHRKWGEAHAEVNALAEAGASARGATLYVTLEPCCHHGKTPPCTDAILRAGVSRVVVARTDPFPQVSGGGVDILRAAGVTVDLGVQEPAARRLLGPYLKLLSSGRPYVHLKWAMTLDGKICTRTGASKWISNEASRRRAADLRGRMDAIIVGIGTVLADDPLLTARPPGPRVATRIVLDSRCRLPPHSKLVKTAQEAPVLIATGADGATASQRNLLEQAGVEVLDVSGPDGRPQVSALLDALGKRRLTNVLVEGGAGVLGSFVDAREVDEVQVFIAPRILGGPGKSPVAGQGAETIQNSLPFMDWQVEMIDGDVLLHGWA
jgi:diaminohydroxyphosphoribosylaminopyrimidine deaminase/5-amino-6-(5-phosphoribosylamino)uracil reductase